MATQLNLTLRRIMAFTINEALLDLGEFGVVAMSMGGLHELPIPAQRIGYAALHRADGQRFDVAALCTRHVARSVLQALIEVEGKRLRGAVASVTRHIEWVTEMLSDDYRESPTFAYALSGCRALFIFGGRVRPHVFRVVDFSSMQIVYEQTLDQLRARFNIKPMPVQRESMLFGPMVYAANTDSICVLLGQAARVLHVGTHQFELIDMPKLSNDFCVELTKSYWLTSINDTPQLSFGLLADARVKSQFVSSTRKKNSPTLSCAKDADRFAFSHAGGEIEIVDIDHAHIARSVASLRPIVRTNSKDCLNMSLSNSGRYCLASSAADGSMLVDLHEMRAAPVHVPDAMIDSDRTRRSHEIHYRPASLLTDRGGYVLHNQVLEHTPFTALSWHAIPSSQHPAKPATTHHSNDTLMHVWRRWALRLGLAKRATADDRIERLMHTWRRCALRLGGKGDGKSQLYGDPYLPHDVSWPTHEGVPMALVCQLAMEEIDSAARDPLWPTDGALLFFVAVSRSGDLLEDESFNPVKIVVIWIASLANEPRERQDKCSAERQPITFLQDPSSLPQVDAVAVAAAKLSDAEYNHYREKVETELPDGAHDGDRIGGYPHLLQSNTLEWSAFVMAQGREPKAYEIAEVAKWRLLLQVASDDLFMWGTYSGILYFMIHDDDLAKKCFDRVQAICEGC